MNSGHTLAQPNHASGRPALWSRGVAILMLAGISAGCPRSDGSTHEPGTRQVAIKSFSEPSAVRLLTAAPPYVFAASERGLVRWDARTGDALVLDTDHGLPGERVEAMAYEELKGLLWIATDRAAAVYDVKQNTFVELPAAPVESFVGVALAPDGEGGLWLGYNGGLVHAGAQGAWQESDVSQPIGALMTARNRTVWMGTPQGAVSRAPDGTITPFGPAEGCDVIKVRFMAEAAGGVPVIVGENQAGEQRIALVLSGKCATYRSSPDVRWLAAARGTEELVVLTPQHLYGMRMSRGGARSLSREGMRLLPVSVLPDSSPRKSPYAIRSLDEEPPASPQSIAVLGEHALVGTAGLGIARLPVDKGSGQPGWLRPAELVRGAQALTVACVSRTDCFVATGGAHAWRYNGRDFAREDVEGLRVLAFVQSPGGDIYALARNANETKIVAYRRVDQAWSQVAGLEIEVPNRKPAIRCARFGPAGLLWVGLAYEDEDGDVRSYGMAAVDVSLAVTVYHRDSDDKDDAGAGLLPIPIGVHDVAFQDESLWLATTQGATHVRGQDIVVYSEANGLANEFLLGIAVAPSGLVYTASGGGVGVYQNGEWRYPADLRWPVNDVEMGADGRLWMATDRGVAVYDGARVRRFDRRRGLMQNEIIEVRADRFGRIWARGSQGLVIITP